MTQRDEQLVIPLNKGVHDKAIDELLGPNMRQSKNTRFTVDRGLTRKAPSLLIDRGGLPYPRCGYSLVPCGRGAVVGYSVPGNEQMFLDYNQLDLPANSRLPVVPAPILGPSNTRQNCYHPLQAVAAYDTGATTARISTGDVFGTATVVNGQLLWVISLKTWDSRGTQYASGAPPVQHTTAGQVCGMFATIFDAKSGEVIARESLIAAFSSGDAATIARTLRVTKHDSVASINVWYQKASATTIYTAIVSYGSDRAVSIAAAAAVVTPLGSVATTPFEVAAGGTRGHGAATAWLITRDATTATSFAVLEVTRLGVISQTITITTSITNAADPISVAVDVRDLWDGTTTYTHLGVAYMAVGGTAGDVRCRGYSVVAQTSNTVKISQTTVGPSAHSTNDPIQCVIGSYVVPGGSVKSALYVVSTVQNAATLGTSRTYSVISTLLYSSGALVTDTLLDWYQPHGKPTPYHLDLSAATNPAYSGGSVAVPVFPMVRYYGGAALGTAEELLDPALEVFCLAPSDTTPFIVATPVARLGDFTVSGTPRQFAWTSAYESTLVVCYEHQPALDDNLNRYGNELRAVVFDCAARPCSSAIDESGGALIAGAQPAYFDGYETTELAPLFQPILRAATYANASSFTTATYGFAAIYTWTDGAGQRHRSAPCVSQSLSMTNALSARLYVSVPSGTLKNGTSQHAARIEVYCRRPGATVHTFVTDSPTSVSNTLGIAQFDITAPPAATNADLYSDSGELVPVCPGALWDVALIGSRGWAIPAEKRNALLYTKTKVENIAYEWPAELLVTFPASAGKLQKVVELDGNTVALSENGVFVVLGTGPDNTGAGVAYSDPRKIADIGCIARDSVCRTRAGIVYATRGGFALLAPGGGVSVMHNIDPASLGTIAGCVELRSGDEVLVFGDGTGTYKSVALNYETGDWSVWDQIGAIAARMPIWHAALLPPPAAALVGVVVGSPSAYSAQPGTPQVVVQHGDEFWSVMDPDSTTPTDQPVVIETGWIQPAGPQGACVLRELVIQGVRDRGAHGLTIAISQDYSTAAEKTLTVTYTAAQLANLVDSGTSRYTLHVSLKAQPARALKITLTESDSTGGALCLLSATLVHSPASQIQRRFGPDALR